MSSSKILSIVRVAWPAAPPGSGPAVGNQAVAAARNERLRHATGHFVCGFDADDRRDEADRARLRARSDALKDEHDAYLLDCRCLPEARAAPTSASPTAACSAGACGGAAGRWAAFLGRVLRSFQSVSRVLWRLQ